MKDQKETRTIPAPKGNDTTKPGALINVDLEADQDVEWIWTHYADGQSAVTGYRTVPRKEDK